MISCIRITRACVAGHPILGELAGTVKRKRREADRKLVAGCYLSDRRRKVNRQRPQRKAMSKPRRRHDASRRAFGETRRGSTLATAIGKEQSRTASSYSRGFARYE